jgi:flagellar biosynthesis/type III secretory pathway ATPase
MEIKGLKEKIENIWFNTFKEFPQFKEMLETERAAKKERLKKHLESLNLSSEQIDGYLNETEIVSNKETIKTLEIIVPILPEVNGKKISNFEEIKNMQDYQDFMKDRVEYFNNFQLEGYIEIPECHSIKMRIENDNNIFTLSLNKETNETKLKEELLGQLIDGLGENLSQKGLLIEDKKYYFDFDVNNASDFYEINNNTNNKMKLK